MTDRVTIPRADWRLPTRDEAEGWKKPPKVIMRCPDCRQEQTVRTHLIYHDGSVMPSSVCPMVGCGFHRFIALEAWEGQACECTECSWTGTEHRADDDSQKWPVCPECGGRIKILGWGSENEPGAGQ